VRKIPGNSGPQSLCADVAPPPSAGNFRIDRTGAPIRITSALEKLEEGQLQDAPFAAPSM
jgi:hypothetical protein